MKIHISKSESIAVYRYDGWACVMDLSNDLKIASKAFASMTLRKLNLLCAHFNGLGIVLQLSFFISLLSNGIWRQIKEFLHESLFSLSDFRPILYGCSVCF